MVLRKLISYITVFVLAVTMIMAGTVGTFATETENSLDNGVLKWSKSLGTSTYKPSSPVYDNGYVYVACDKTLYKLDAETGDVKATVVLDATVGPFATIAPTVGGNYVFVPLNGSKIAIVNKNTMAAKVVQYDSESNGQTISPIAYDASQNCVYVGSWYNYKAKVTDESGNVTRVPKTGGVYARIDASSGAVKVIQENEHGFYWAGACVTDDYVVFGSVSDGSGDSAPANGEANVYCYNKSSGNMSSCTVDGSVCSTVIQSDEMFYFTTKAGVMYEAQIVDGKITIVNKTSIGSASTGDLLIKNGKVYAGCKDGVAEVAIGTGSKTAKIYKTPADTKHLAIVGGKIVCTYNYGPGGIYDPVNGYEYFTPDVGMRQYCISDIAVDSNGNVMFYKNDSGYLMAVKPAAVNIVNNGTYTYTGKPIVPNIKVTCKGKTLVKGTDYKLDCSNCVDAGTGIIKVDGIGNYIFKESLKVTIAKAKQPITASSVKKAYGVDPFTLKATAKGTKTYKSSSTSVATISSTGKVTIKNTGKTTITIKAASTKNYLAASKTVTITVVPKKATGLTVSPKTKRMTVKWNKDSKATGYQIAYARNSSFTKSKKTTLVKSNKTVSKTIKNLKSGKYYYVKVRAYKTIDGVKKYGAYSKVKKVKVK